MFAHAKITFYLCPRIATAKRDATKVRQSLRIEIAKIRHFCLRDTKNRIFNIKVAPDTD